MKIAFTTLGCKLNYAETSTYERGFLKAGWEVVPWSEEANVYLINTCAVTETAEKKSRNYIRRAHKTAPGGKIVVTGCYAELSRSELLEIDGVWKVFGASEKGAIVSTVTSEYTSSVEGMVLENHGHPRPCKREGPIGDGRGLEETFSKTIPSPEETPATFGAFSSGEERTRSFLKVQDGCDNFCAYCTVPYARGRSRSLRICEVVKMAKEIAASGVKEIVLTGVNTGDFGRSNNETFLDLLKALEEVDGISRYRISSIEPNLITEEIVDWIAGSSKKFQKHFHIPLQSGSDNLLRRVGRRYDTSLFEQRISYIRRAMEKPGEAKVFFGIDVIVGLPGETDALFEETYSFLKEIIRPAFIHVFPYSTRPGTRAARWEDQIPEKTKKERVAKIESLCEGLHMEFLEKNRGLREQVLWESSVKNGLMGGYTGNYIRQVRPFDPNLVNKITDIEIQ